MRTVQFFQKKNSGLNETEFKGNQRISRLIRQSSYQIHYDLRDYE